MNNVNTFLKENLPSVSKNVFVAPGIPEKKLNNVAKAFNVADNLNAVLAIYDNTVFGSAKDGIVFTGEKLVIKEAFESPYDVYYNNIEAVEYIEDVTVNDKGKEKRTEFVSLKLKNGEIKPLKSLMECNYKKLSDILEHTISDFDEFKEEDQLITLAEMSEALKVAYVKIIVNMAFSDDGQVDKKEFAEILLLMTRLELTTESRFILRSYIGAESSLMPVEELIAIIDRECVPSHNKSIKISLVKDLISIFMSVNDGEYKNFPFLQQVQPLLGVTDEEIELAVMAIQQDFKMLREDFSDDALKRSMKELTAKAGAVGVPLAAVYLSGSVIGMSAAGITSGLATLGLGGVLGFSSMATGIGVAVLLGVGAYKGIRHLTGANELDKSKRRELMLNEVIKQTQSTLSALINDLNYISGKFNDALDAHNRQGEKIQKLQKMMNALTGAADELNKKSNKMQNSALKLKCPIYLDEAKLSSLTREPIKKQFYDIVLSFYEECIVEEQHDGKTVEVKKSKIKEDTATQQLEKLAAIFEGIGYFRAGDVIKGKLTGLFS
ncbi:hypothetical protein ACNPM1_06965 [Enterobacter pseudoroggenkampii]|uniref:hypothetical protein n=1 Tax=Enterobacter pseudoroggenkampii TaxID=2996112 RepID=UPI0020036909|nr:hypothetical protein [Enterobacter asburiae]